MIKLKKKYSNLILNFSIGDVLKVFYIIILRTRKKKKRTYSFIGLCINKKKNYFDLVNVVKKEKIIISFDLKSPVLYKLVIMKTYKKVVYRISRIYFKIKNYYFDDNTNFKTTLVSDFDSFTRDFFYSAYYKRRITKRRRRNRKLKRKYFRTENWKILLDEYSSLNEIDSV